MGCWVDEVGRLPISGEVWRRGREFSRELVRDDCWGGTRGAGIPDSFARRESSVSCCSEARAMSWGLYELEDMSRCVSSETKLDSRDVVDVEVDGSPD
jgi:hypothetical protein